MENTYYGTNNDDSINGYELSVEYINIDLLDGDDTISLTSSQTFVSGPGNDTLVGDGKSGYALWHVNEPVYVNLKEGYASDGFGYTDTISGIGTVHMTSLGGTIIGTSNNEKVFSFGGDSYYDLGDGEDTVVMYQMNSSDYQIELKDGIWFLQGNNDKLEFHNVEEIDFDDKKYITDLVPYIKYEPYVFDAETATGNSWFERVDLNQDGLIDIVYYANSLRSWSTNFEILPEAYLQVIIQQPDGSLVNKTDELITNNLSSIMANDPHLGDFNGDGILDFVLAGSGRDTYVDGSPVVIDSVEFGEPDVFFLSQPDGTWECSKPVDRNVWSHNITAGDINLDGLDDTFSSSLKNINTGHSFFTLGDKNGNLVYDQTSLPYWLTKKSEFVTYNGLDGKDYQGSNTYTGSLLFDANGDHAVDLLVLPMHDSKTSLLFLNDGFGDFSKSEAIELPYGPYGPGGYTADRSIVNGSVMLEAVGLDIDHDGDNDVVTLSTNSNVVDGVCIDYYNGTKLQVLLNDGTGHFTVGQTVELIPEDAPNYCYYHDIDVYDVNRDGWADIVAKSIYTTGYYKTAILLNYGGRLENATDTIVPNKINSFIPLHVDGKLGLVEFYHTWYASDPRDNAGLSTTTFTLMTNPDFEVGHTIAGGTAAEQHIGSPKNDKFIWSCGSDAFNGLDGIDSLEVPGNLSDIDITKTNSDTSLTFGHETVHMTSIERIEANDSSLALDIEGTAGVAYRIYQAAFDRTPDLEGLGYWIHQMDTGMSLQDVSNSFIDSEEFINLYGENTPNEDFVILLYNNVLHRDPDASGMAYWMNELNTGIISQAGILASFSESAENIANVEDVIATGIEYIEYGSLI